MSFSQVQVLGHLGSDPELSYTSEGTPVAKFSIAVTEKSKNGDTTTWYACTAWRGLAEAINEYAAKGSLLFVQGRLVPRQYTTKDGRQGFSLDVQVEKFSFAGGSPKKAERDKTRELTPF
jgi:single-strand DNA-binding protein